MTLEAAAVEHALELWSRGKPGVLFVLRVDNQAVVAGLRSGRIAHKATQAVLRNIAAIVHRRLIAVHPVWVSSSENYRADALSRMQPDALEPLPVLAPSL